MAFHVSVHQDLHLVFTEYSGRVDTDQMIGALQATLDDPDYVPGMTDVSGVTAVDLDFQTMLAHRTRMAAHYGGQSEHTPHFVVASTDLGYGMARMYQTLSEDGVPHMTLNLFRSEPDALQAMGRTETSISDLLGR